MGSSVRVEVHPGAIERLLRGTAPRAYRRRQATLVAAAWRANIHRITGATQAGIRVVDEGEDVLVVADPSTDPDTAWLWLEYGTSSMPAQHPGRRAIRR